MKTFVEIGGHVVWVDPMGVPHDALVTAIWGGRDQNPSINVVVVNRDDGQTDSYGQKIQRETSVVHRVNQGAHGRFWYLPSEA